MQIVTVANQKGGTGKTATAAALAQAAAFKGKKVLAIDLDPQGNLSYTLKANTNAKNSYDVISGGLKLKNALQTVNGIDVIPASWNLATLTSRPGSAKRLQNALQAAKLDYDIIIIDTPPTAGEAQYNAMQASTGLIIPMEADTFSIQGLYQTMETAKAIQKSNPDLQVLGIVLTRYKPRSTITKHLTHSIGVLAMEMEVPILGTVREAIALKEAHALQRNLYEYAPKCNPALDYMEICNKIIGE